jgi:hypothetical protein
MPFAQLTEGQPRQSVSLFVWAGPAQIILISTLGSAPTVAYAAIAVSGDPVVPDGGVGLADASHADNEAASSGARSAFHRGHVVGRMLSPVAAGAARTAHRVHAWAGQRSGFALSLCYDGRLRSRRQFLPELFTAAILLLTPLAFLLSTARNCRQLADVVALSAANRACVGS